MQAMTTWQVPGLALAIVRNDSVIYAKGYGVRSIETRAPVDARTLFAIGSDSKAFTAGAVAMLVTDGKMRYDAPVTQYLPWFQLYDPWVTRQVTIRDLLTHRSGLDQHDAVWYGTGLSRDEVIRQVRFIKPDFSFRSRFGYSNMMYLTAGQAAAAAAGVSWDLLVHDRIFVPLGMTSSNTSIRAEAGVSDVATPHGLAHDTVYTMPYRNVDDIGPAGAINSNVIDMAQWVRFQLSGGVYNGKRLVGEAPFRENHISQTLMGTTEEPFGSKDQSHVQAYGMGWVVSDYRHNDFWVHEGGIDGMLSLVGMLPKQHFGIVILTNMNYAGAAVPVQQWIFDHELGVNPVPDWSAEMHKSVAATQARANARELAVTALRQPDTKPSLPLAAYAGTYSDSTFGDVVIALVDGKLMVRRGELTGPLEHWHHDVFRVTWNTRWLGTSFVEFAVGSTNKVDTLSMTVLGDHLVLDHQRAATRSSTQSSVRQ